MRQTQKRTARKIRRLRIQNYLQSQSEAWPRASCSALELLAACGAGLIAGTLMVFAYLAVAGTCGRSARRSGARAAELDQAWRQVLEEKLAAAEQDRAVLEEKLAALEQDRAHDQELLAAQQADLEVLQAELAAVDVLGQDMAHDQELLDVGRGHHYGPHLLCAKLDDT